MDLYEVAQNLIKFRTETGNIKQIDRCVEDIIGLFAGTEAKIKVFREEPNSPVIYISTTDDMHLDALVLGHIDVVPADKAMFSPRFEEGKMLGRGSLDMKSFAAVALCSMNYVLHCLPDLKFGVILSSDEETGSKGTEKFLEKFSDLNADVVLDNDVGGDITKIITKCKNPLFIKLKAYGKEAHGSTPWEGIDANEKLMQTWENLRKIYPYYSLEGNKPSDNWTDTLHFAQISGGTSSNVISDYAEAVLDFRLTENSKVDTLLQNIRKCLPDGVEFEIMSQGVPVVMNENDGMILQYKSIAENILQQKIEFEHIGGATDSRAFAQKGAVVVMHSGTGEGMHAKNEYVVWRSVEQLSDIQIKFLQHLASAKNKK